MSTSKTESGRPVAWILAACFLAWAVPLAADNDCRAKITVDLQSREETDDQVRLRFAVDLSAPESCASATYDLILVELLPNQQWKSVRKTRSIELHEGTAAESVEHVMASELKLLEYEARIVECSPCAVDR